MLELKSGENNYKRRFGNSGEGDTGLVPRVNQSDG